MLSQLEQRLAVRDQEHAQLVSRVRNNLMASLLHTRPDRTDRPTDPPHCNYTHTHTHTHMSQSLHHRQTDTPHSSHVLTFHTASLSVLASQNQSLASQLHEALTRAEAFQHEAQRLRVLQDEVAPTLSSLPCICWHAQKLKQDALTYMSPFDRGSIPSGRKRRSDSLQQSASAVKHCRR